jgi:hypothetical protein
MSQTVVALLLLLPIALFILFLNRSGKSRYKKREAGYLNYLKQVKEETGIHVNFKQLLHQQLVVLDETNKKLLVIDGENGYYSYSLFKGHDLKSFDIKYVKQSFILDAKTKKSETITLRSGLEIVSLLPDQPVIFISFYDHEAHNNILLDILQKEAIRLQERIRALINEDMSTD